MKVALVCPYDLGSYGGVQSVTLDLVARLRSGGDEAFVVGPGADAAFGIDIGRSVNLPGNGSNAPIALGPRVRSRVRDALADVDVVHVHEPMMPRTSTAALGVAKPVVATFHAAVAPWTTSLYRRLERVGRRLLGSATLTAVSPTAMAGLPDSWAPVTIIPNGIDVESFQLHRPRVRGRIVVVGRDEPRKGLDVALQAFDEVRRTRPDTELHVIGADRRPIDGVVFHGRIGDGEKRELLASAEVYVAPHLGGESFGIVIAEAMAAGCAVVASDLSAFRSVGGEAVEYVAVSDVSAMASAITEILADEARRALMAQSAADRVRAFDWSVVVGRYRDLYERVANIGM